MPSPNAAGYYSLTIPEAIEVEFKQLDYSALSYTLQELCWTLNPNATYYAFTNISEKADDWYDQLQTSDRLSLIRWVADLLASKFNATP